MDEVFSGGVFSDTLDDGRAGAEIKLSPAGIDAQVVEGEKFFIPYRDCSVEMGGYNGRMVFCRDAAKTVTIFCEDKRFPKALSLAASGTLDEQLGTSKKKRKQVARRDRRILTGVLVVTAVLLVAGYFGVRAGAKAAIQALPVSIDRQIGNAAFQSMDLGGPEIEDKVVVEAMQKIVDRLEPHALIDGMRFEVHVVQSETVNAFCLPGGQIVVYTGLIESAENVNQVAAVLGHEMAHATLRHGLERMGQSMGIYAAVTLLIGDVSGLMAVGVDLFQVASVNSYSREQENAADAEGVRMLHSADLDPAPMARFFEIMEEQHGDLPGFMSWISTHPDHADRIDSVNALVASLEKKEYKPIEIDWPEVQARVKNK